MLKANFNTYASYTTDSLHQWDKDQNLIINGLSLTTAPEIHFANANMDRAIVRQAELKDGAVIIKIPNSILQEALTIKAYVGVYEGSTFTIIESIEIPVIAKARPADYSLTDEDEEVYSFIRLENELLNAKRTMLEDVEKSARALEARIDNIISNNANTDGNTELVDIRTSVDGTIHNSAGTAVRSIEKKANVGFVFTNEPPVVEFVDKDRVSLELKGTTHVFFGNNGRYDIPASTVVYTMNGEYRVLFKVICNVKDKLVRIVHSQEIIPDGWILIGFIHKNKVQFNTWMCSYDDSSNGGALSPASIIIGFTGSEKYVKFDSANKTVTFPDDTVIMFNGKNGCTYHTLSIGKNNLSASWADISTSAINLFYNLDTKKLEFKAYNTSVKEPYILLASIRTTKGIVAMTVPYTWDGVLLNSISGTGSNMSRNYNVKSVNHRGYSSEAPENTLSAFKLSKLKGYDYVECDVAFTADNVAVLLHDSTVDRTSNGTGNISELTFNEVRALDFGSWKSSTYAGEKIPTFEEFMILCRNIGLHPYIEIKNSATYTSDQIKSLIDIVKRVGMRNNVTWISFTNQYLEYVKNHDNKARLGYLVSDITESIINTITALKTGENEVFIDATYSALTAEKVALCVDADLPLEAWTINTSDTIRLLDPYVSGVTSDNLIAGEILYTANIK